MAETRKPLLILSFRQRDELAAIAARGGWRVIAARRSPGLERRLMSSGASVVVIDARDAIEEGLAATRALGDAVATEARALLILVSREDAGAIARFREAGATHFLASPTNEVELVEALRFAELHGDRVSGGAPLAMPPPAEPLGWRYDPALRSLQLTPALARLLGMPATPGVGALLGRLDRSERLAFRAALRRLSSGYSTAFAHDVDGIGRVVEHLQRDPRTGRLHALVEPLGAAPDASAAMRDALPGRGLRSLTAMARDLPRAIEAGEIDILFQPQVSFPTGAVTGVEALARWRHPHLGEVGAEMLLAAADRAGLGLALSDHLQRKALAIAARWPAALAGLRLAINITADDVARTDFAQTMLDRIVASGFAPSRLTLELTESGLIEDLDAAARGFATWRTAGCAIAIDDFGTGYSSLAYLQALPLDYLKMDKALTAGIAGSARDRIVVRGVIAMARSLGLGVIAEGVETEDQRARLANEGCDFYQGYLYAPPLDSGALVDRILAAAR